MFEIDEQWRNENVEKEIRMYPERLPKQGSVICTTETSDTHRSYACKESEAERMWS